MYRNFYNKLKLLPAIWFVSAWILFIVINFHQHIQDKFIEKSGTESQKINNHCYSCDFIFSTHHFYTDELYNQIVPKVFYNIIFKENFHYNFFIISNQKILFPSRAPPTFI